MGYDLEEGLRGEAVVHLLIGSLFASRITDHDYVSPIYQQLSGGPRVRMCSWCEYV